jgi:histidinol phosphatase-like enzyme
MTDQMDNILKGIEKEIEEILYEYIKTESFTNTRNEKQAEEFFINFFF